MITPRPKHSYHGCSFLCWRTQAQAQDHLASRGRPSGQRDQAEGWEGLQQALETTGIAGPGEACRRYTMPKASELASIKMTNKLLYQVQPCARLLCRVLTSIISFSLLSNPEAGG